MDVGIKGLGIPYATATLQWGETIQRAKALNVLTLADGTPSFRRMAIP